MGALQPWHWIVLIAVILLLFGSSRLPGLAKSVGQSMKIFKSEVNELRADGKDADKDSSKDTTTEKDTTTGEPAADGQQRAPKGDDAPKA
ncbi:Sec-independent protein translocase subunit TatA [Myceligenerans cantabricum]